MVKIVSADKDINMNKTKNNMKRSLPIFNVGWLGQMVASILWALSVFVYGITTTGDVLQLCAALAWTIANLATLKSPLSNSEEQFVISPNVKESNGS